MSMQDHMPPVDAPAGPTANDKTMGMLAHLLGIPFPILGAGIIWLTQKDTSVWVSEESKEALNFQITVTIGYIVASILLAVLIGALLFPVIGLVALIFGILGGLEANKGNHYKYPFALRLVK